MSKQDTYPPKSTLVANDYATGVDSTGPSTIRILMSAILNFVWTLANIPSGGTSPITRDNESQFAFVASGLVITADAPGSTKNASMTAGVVYINGRRISIAAVAGRTYTASNDTYVDVLDNGDGTGTVVYTAVTNNAASPALAANSIRIGIIITGASNIANSGSVNQGQTTAVLPIASSNAYSVTDSLGNLIFPTDPQHKVLGYRQITGNTSSTATSAAAITGLSVPVIVPANRKVKITISAQQLSCLSLQTTYAYVGASLGTLTTQVYANDANGITEQCMLITPPISPSTGLNFYTAAISTNNGANSATLNASSTAPTFIMVELE